MKQLNKQYQEFTFYPEKVIQFGEGNFMRGFFDWQLQQMNKAGHFNGSAVVVQPINQGLGTLLEKQDNLYTVILEGLLEGEIVNTSEIITTVNRVINPYQEWQAYLDLAENDALEFIVSNTTEAGIAFDETDQLTDQPPKSFPAKLTALLFRRYQLGKKGFTIIPCELINRNGEKLRQIIQQYIALWELEKDFSEWLENENTFCCSLVDRIVPGYPRDRAAELNAQHGYEDQLMVKAEPFLLWVIEGPASLKESLPLAKAGLNVVVTEDMTPYRERKVHLLNGPHTAMVPLGLLAGLETVEEVMQDADFSVFIDQLFDTQLIPMLDLPKEELEVYAAQIKERFKNPFVRHELTSIALNSVSKFTARLLPILLRYQKQTQTLPTGIVAALSALFVCYRGDGPKPQDDAHVLALFKQAFSEASDPVEFLLQQSDLWQQDLSQVPALSETIRQMMTVIDTSGSRVLVQELNKNVGENVWKQPQFQH
ncbi:MULTISPECIES: tagaturonate reductase [Enterococcus]|uniref:tagaturonate reductase n=1 Tax=Enterococcus TaxID=1350 RepID=UPI0010F97DFA|nr:MULTISPECIES: tagaturonate reductase [Enterococcus]KAF1300574.1 altronate oxidoreductase [Enterococcus sp. JM9B]